MALLNGPLGLRTYIPEPQRNTNWKWRARPAEQQVAVLGNRRRVRGPRGKRLQRGRSELTERSFAHVCETGGARRCWLRGLVKVSKRYLLQVAARNLSLIMRKLFGVGTPRGLQSESDASSLTDFTQILLATLWTTFWRAWNTLRSRAHLALETLTATSRLRPPRGTADFQQPARRCVFWLRFTISIDGSQIRFIPWRCSPCLPSIQ